MDDVVLHGLLQRAKVVAVIGANDSAGRPVDRVGRYLIHAGYTVIPVHPVRKKVWGLPCYPELDAIETPVDIVNVFRAAQYCAEHARQALRLRPRPGLFWMQLGIENPEAEGLLFAAGMPCVRNACLMLEHMRLTGKNDREQHG